MVKHCYSILRIHAWWQQLDKTHSRNRAFNLEWTLIYEWRSVRLTAPLWDSTEQTHHIKLEPRVKEIQFLIQHWIILLVRHSVQSPGFNVSRSQICPRLRILPNVHTWRIITHLLQLEVEEVEVVLLKPTKLQQFRSHYWIFKDISVGPSLSVIVATKTGILSQTMKFSER